MDSQSLAVQHKTKGNEYYSAKNYTAAIEEYSKAHELDPSAAVYLSNRAACYIEVGKYKQAIDDCQKGVTLTTDADLLSKLHLRLARASLYIGNYESAATFFSKVSNLDQTSQQLLDICKQYKPISLQDSRSLISKLPYFRPVALNSTEWFPIGNETPGSFLLDPIKEQEVLDKKRKIEGASNRAQISEDVTKLLHNNYTSYRFYLGGVGDPRHLLETLLDFFQQLKQDIRKVHLDFHVNDILPEVLARDIMIMLALKSFARFDFQEVVKAEKGELNEALQHAVFVYVLWLGYNLPPPQHTMLNQLLDKLITLSEDATAFSSDSLTNWLHIANPADLRTLNKVWKFWRADTTPLSFVLKEVAKLSKHSDSVTGQLLQEAAPNIGGMRAMLDMLDEKTLTALSGNIPDPSAKRMFDKLPFDKKKDFIASMMAEQMGEKSQTSGFFTDELNFIKKKHMLMLPSNIVAQHDYSTHITNPTLLGRQLSLRIPEGAIRSKEEQIVVDMANLDVLLEKQVDDWSLFLTMVEKMHLWGIALMSCRDTLDVTLHTGDLHTSINDLSKQDPPMLFDRIGASNVPDYTGLIHVFLYLIPALKPISECRHSGIDTKVLFTTGLYRNFEQYLYSTVRVKSVKELESILGVKWIHGDMWSLFIRWAPMQLPLPAEKLVSQQVLRDYIFNVLLWILFPMPTNYNAVMREYHPQNLKTFVLLLHRLKEVGYPSHWLGDAIRDILTNNVQTSARPPQAIPDSIPTSTLPKKAFNMAPYVSELSLLLAIAQPYLDFGIPAQLPPLADIVYVTGIVKDKLPQFNAGDLHSPTLGILVSPQSSVRSLRDLPANSHMFTVVDTNPTEYPLPVYFRMPRSLLENDKMKAVLVRFDMDIIVSGPLALSIVPDR